MTATQQFMIALLAGITALVGAMPGLVVVLKRIKEVHKIVNGQRTEMTARIASLEDTLRNMHEIISSQRTEMVEQIMALKKTIKEMAVEESLRDDRETRGEKRHP